MKPKQKIAIALIALFFIAAIIGIIYFVSIGENNALLPTVLIIIVTGTYLARAAVPFIKDFYAKRQIEDAIEDAYYDEIKDMYTSDSIKRKKLIKALIAINSNHYKHALKIIGELQRGAVNVEERGKLLMFRGVAYRHSGAIRKAIDNFNLSLQTNGELYQSASNLGSLYSSMGDFEKAEEFYLQAIKINPKYLNAVNNLAAMYMQHGKFEKAVEYGERVLSINPSRHEPRSALAISYASLGDYIKAEEHFNLYAIADPESGKNLRLMLNNIKERHLSEVKYGGSDPRDYDDYDEDNEEE